MYAIYAFCRAVDDIADDGGPREPRRAALDRLARPTSMRSSKTRCRELDPRPRRADAALRPEARGFPRRHRRHGDGPRGRTSYAPDWATLDLYCDRVASAVGRLVGAHLRRRAASRRRARASSRPRAAADQHPARPRRGRGDGPPLSAARGACRRRHRGRRPRARRDPRASRISRRPAARSPRAPQSISRRPTGS